MNWLDPKVFILVLVALALAAGGFWLASNRGQDALGKARDELAQFGTGLRCGQAEWLPSDPEDYASSPSDALGFFNAERNRINEKCNPAAVWCTYATSENAGRHLLGTTPKPASLEHTDSHRPETMAVILEVAAKAELEHIRPHLLFAVSEFCRYWLYESSELLAVKSNAANKEVESRRLMACHLADDVLEDEQMKRLLGRENIDCGREDARR